MAAFKISSWLLEAPLMVARHSISILKHIMASFVFLPDVLSRPGLDHDPHLKLLCALRHDRREGGRVTVFHEQPKRQTVLVYLHPPTPVEALYLLPGLQHQLHKEWELRSSPSSPGLALLYEWATNTDILQYINQYSCSKLLVGTNIPTMRVITL